MLKEINAMMSLENMALTRKELNCLENCLTQPAIIPCVRRDIIQNYQKPVILQSQTKDDCYPDTSILINLLNLQNEDELFNAERQLVSLRLLEFYLDPIEGTFDLTYLKTLHHFLFQDLYSWAGEIRTCNIAKGSLFCLAPYIESYAQEIFRSLEQNHYYFQLPDDKKIPALISLYSDINALHPFREGNGRTQRLFMQMLAKANHLELSFVGLNAKTMVKASHLAMNGHEEMMLKCLFPHFKHLTS